MDQSNQTSFSAGLLERSPAASFSDQHVAKAKGFVLEADGSLRSQPAIQSLLPAGTIGGEMGVVEDLVIYRTSGDVWRWFQLPAVNAVSPLAPVTSATFTGAAMPHTSGLSPVGVVPYRDATYGWVSALLFAGHTTGPAYLVYKNPDTGNPYVVSQSTRYPAAGTTGIPKGNVAAMWGDYLVLGAIEWARDPAAPYSDTNRMTHPHGLWFSGPGDVQSWDQIDVEYVGIGERDTGITGLFPMDMGMLVFTQTAVWLLRGTPSDHDFELLRPGIGTRQYKTANVWNETGAVAFVDGAGQVWHSNGEDFLRLDTPLADPVGAYTDCVGALGPHLIVSRDGRLLAFRAFEGDGSWTELSCPVSVKRMFPGPLGTLVLEGSDGSIWRIAPAVTAERGMVAGVAVTLELGTRTLENGGHRTGFWHRFGLRATGTGTLVDAAILPRPALAGTAAGVTETVNEAVTARGQWAFRAHGPSVEASCRFRFTGDVIVESVSVWAHEGREDR